MDKNNKNELNRIPSKKETSIVLTEMEIKPTFIEKVKVADGNFWLKTENYNFY